MNIYLTVALRTILSILVLLTLARMAGSKQISQLSFYDYIVGITAGSIAASLCIDTQIPIAVALIGIVLFMLSSIFFSFLTTKSMFFRRVLTGKPIFLIARGEILSNGLKKSHFDINDLLRELRSQGYFDLSEINYALLEPNGAVSILPKAYARAATVADMSLKALDATIKANIIIDGKIMKGNLEALGRDKAWLEVKLKEQKVVDIRQVLLATLDENGALSIYYKNKKEDLTSRTLFQ